jgi:hypothetical protein
MILLFIYFEIHGRFPTSPLIPYNIKFVQRGFTKLRIICAGLELTLQILSSTRQRNSGSPCRVSAHNTHPSHFLFIQVIFNIPVKKVRSYFFLSFFLFFSTPSSEWVGKEFYNLHISLFAPHVSSTRRSEHALLSLARHLARQANYFSLPAQTLIVSFIPGQTLIVTGRNTLPWCTLLITIFC